MAFISRLLIAGLLGGGSWPLAAMAQTGLPACPPPEAQEYLLLIRGEDESDRNRIASVLPEENSVLICAYAGEELVRAGGFTRLETANAWAAYMNDIEGYETFVSALGEQQPEAIPGIAYQPEPLSSGYAVLVDYGNRPDIAAAVQQQLDQPVGLAVYRQRPYLLTSHTEDARTAVKVLDQLSEADFSVFLVDGQQVVRIAADVAAIAADPALE